MPSAISACAIRRIPAAISCRARARPRWSSRTTSSNTTSTPSRSCRRLPRPYSERVIHGEIFKARPDVNAVCHHHSPGDHAVRITGVPLVPVYHLGAAMGRDAPFWDSRDEFGDTNLLVVKPEEGASLARALGDHNMVVMRRHGATVVGGDLRELVFRTIYSARNAEYQLAAPCWATSRRSRRAKPRWRASCNRAARAGGARLGILGEAARRAQGAQADPRCARRAARAAPVPAQERGESEGESEESKSRGRGNDELLRSLALALFALASPAAAQDTLKIAIGQINNWENQAPTLGQDAGIFKKHNSKMENFGTPARAKPSRR